MIVGRAAPENQRRRGNSKVFFFIFFFIFFFFSVDNKYSFQQPGVREWLEENCSPWNRQSKVV